MDKEYVVAILVTIPAASYEAALKEAETMAENWSQDAGIGVEVVRDHEHDNDGQRVVYLHPEDKPE